MFELNHPILVVCMGTSHMMHDSLRDKNFMKSPILITPVALEGFNFSFTKTFNQFLKMKKNGGFI
jgi:hypothetical protein